jgi:hypothetical protein
MHSGTKRKLVGTLTPLVITVVLVSYFSHDQSLNAPQCSVKCILDTDLPWTCRSADKLQ